MLGHKLFQVLGPRFDVYGTIRTSIDDMTRLPDIDSSRVIPGVDVSVEDVLEEVIVSTRPDVVINAAGVIKQKPSSKDVETTLTVNSIVPHRLAAYAEQFGFRLICISTDCVFRGDRGDYNEEDIPDALDIYGQSKHWGEVVESHNCLTLRTSIIGHELSSSGSLIDWFFSNRGGQVKGFRKAIYSGFPTITFSRLIAEVLEAHPDLRGLYHVSSEPIDKYSLLQLVRSAANLEIDIHPDDNFVIDRSLNSDRFRRRTGFRPAGWEQMIEEMCSDPTEYKALNRAAGTL